MTSHEGTSGHTALGGGREFDAIRALLARWGARARGVGDDAATLDLPPGARLVVSTDASVEDVHFRRDWFTPEEVGWRAATSAISDLAAMAARPLGLLLAASVPGHWRDALLAIADGVGEAAAAAGCPIVGGDLTGGRDLVLTVTVLGEATRPVTRAGARPGDVVYVTGRLGGPRRALAALLRDEAPAPADRARFAHPEARVREALWLAQRGAGAIIDISDGLLADAGHVAAASGVRVRLDPALVPHVDGATAGDALVGGEEYELCCAVPADLDPVAFAHAFGVPLTRVGTVEALAGGLPGVVLPRGTRVDLPAGHDHFTR